MNIEKKKVENFDKMAATHTQLAASCSVLEIRHTQINTE